MGGTQEVGNPASHSQDGASETMWSKSFQVFVGEDVSEGLRGERLLAETNGPEAGDVVLLRLTRKGGAARIKS